MLEGIVADVLVRVLGSYVDGLNKESIRVGVWKGDLELKRLRLRPDALAVLFETLGLDLPVTVTGGYIGLLRLEVPWKSLRSAPVRIFMHDVTIVASPVSDGDQSALELREKRLKAARLATDEAVRDAKFSVRSEVEQKPLASTTTMDSLHSDVRSDAASSAVDNQSSGYGVTRWGWRFTSRVVTKIVDNIQIDVENVIIQYEDASSVRERPYTATLALDSLRACSTNHLWDPVFIEDPFSPVVHKVIYLRGLVLNWEPGNEVNDLKKWILNAQSDRTAEQWAGFVRKCTRHAIKPMDGELRIALTKSSALAAAMAGRERYRALRNVPRVQMDLHFPDVKIVLDDFQYHTLLSTIMYLSDIDRKVRPKTARGRWLWALDRLLPRFKERREAAMSFNVEGLKQRRLKREAYVKARNAVVSARRKGANEPKKDAKLVEEMEMELPYRDVILFRDVADRELLQAAKEGSTSIISTSRFWSLFSRVRDPNRNAIQNEEGPNPNDASTPGSQSGSKPGSRSGSRPASRSGSRSGSGRNTPKRSRSRERLKGILGGGSVSDRNTVKSDATGQSEQIPDQPSAVDAEQSAASDDPFADPGEGKSSLIVPNFRMGFLLGRGAIVLKEGGFPDSPIPISSLEFGELRLGIETRPGSGLLLEALLGTFQVIDLQKSIKVMYPRAPWSGEQTDVEVTEESRSGGMPPDSDHLMSDLENEWGRSPSLPASASLNSLGRKSVEAEYEEAVLHSYPHEISNAIRDIRGEYGMENGPLPATSPIFPKVNRYCSSLDGGSSENSLSAASEGQMSISSLQNIEDLSVVIHSPLRYIAALRLNQEEATGGDWASGATRMAMDLAIGGMEVLLDGPKGAFISSIGFWHPREKMPSIMHFLMRAAAPRLASLRMDIQKALLERSVPMRMDMLIRGPRFVVPGSPGSDVSMVLDLGTFAMETSTGPPQVVTPDVQASSLVGHVDGVGEPLSIRYTDYQMACSDLGLFVVSAAGKQAAERVIRPFSVHLLLQVLHNSSFIEAMTLVYGKVSIPKVKLQAQLPLLKTSVSHNAFRQILDVFKGWGERSRKTPVKSGIEPNPVAHSVSLPADLEQVRIAHDQAIATRQNDEPHRSSPLIAFEMRLEFDDVQLELRDASSKRVVTVTTTGTVVKMRTRLGLMDLDFRVRTFAVVDGSRGATAPFRRLAYAGTEKLDSNHPLNEAAHESKYLQGDSRSFISLSYRGDMLHREQTLAVKILSLNLVCVRETYFALADFFYLTEKRSSSHSASRTPSEQQRQPNWDEFHDLGTDNPSETAYETSGENEYSDPFAALGTTTSAAARVLREHAGRGMELSKQALANRGRLSVNADLDGVKLTLVTADGAIGCFDVNDCKVRLTQDSTGAVNASGELGGFCVKDLTAAYDVYSETIRYVRATGDPSKSSDDEVDGWSFRMPAPHGDGDMWLEAKLCNLRIVYLQRFIIILKKYFDALKDSLKPVLEMKGGIGEVFETVSKDEFAAIFKQEGRMRVNILTEEIDIVMPRHSQSPYEALRFSVPRSSITNEDLSAPGYQIGFQIEAEGVSAYVLYEPPAEGEGRALTEGGKDPVLRQISPNCPISKLVPFSENIYIFAKLDMWRERKVPEVILNADGIPVLKDGQEEREYDPAKWLPLIRVRVSAPSGISARLCEAEYSILYFTFTENVIERPDIEFTDIVRGLKTPVLPARKPVQPIMFSSNKMPPNYQIIFEVPHVSSVIMSGADQTNSDARLILSELNDITGSFEYGVDYRMTIEVNGNMSCLKDVRPGVPTHGKTLIMRAKKPGETRFEEDSSKGGQLDIERSASKDITFTWDRPFGFRSNVMLVATDLRIIVEPELFRDLGKLTVPGLPFLKSSAPAPLVRFNGRLLIATISRPEIWLMANQYPGDGRSLVVRGDVIAKVQWAAVTGRKMLELAANGIHVNLSSVGPFSSGYIEQPSPQVRKPREGVTETPMLYPCDVSMKFDGSGYDPPKKPGEEPTKIPSSTLSVNTESFLFRIDVNDAPLILAVGSRLVRLRPSSLSSRPSQPGRFEEWTDRSDDGDAKLAVHFALPHSRLMFTDESGGRYVPIMEARLKNLVLKSNVPWLSNLAFQFALDLFNEEKGWWEPGIEAFPIEIAASTGRSGSQAIHVRADKVIDVNVTPNTVYGAARVSKALKSAIEDLTYRLRMESTNEETSSDVQFRSLGAPSESLADPDARRPSLAAFCVRNETGRTMTMWLPYDSTRRSLRGNGGEVEVDTPTKELLWTAIGAKGGLSADPNKNRQLSMRCVVSLSGFEPLTLSAAETSSRLVTFVPDKKDIAQFSGGMRSESPPITLVWSVVMRDGVPCGCLRSILRLVNMTRDIVEVNVGGLKKSFSLGDELNTWQETSRDPEGHVHALLKPGEAWSVPVHSVHRSIRMRPAIFSAPDSELEDPTQSEDLSRARARVYYSYKWSDPLSKLTTLQVIGDELVEKEKQKKTSAGSGRMAGTITPILACTAVERNEPFCFSIHPKVFRDVDSQSSLREDVSAWLDVNICPPLVLENLLPRPVSFKLAMSSHGGGIRREHIVGHGSIEPLREAHIHTASTDFKALSVALGVDNTPHAQTNQGHSYTFPSRQVGDFHENLSSLTSLPMGTGRYVPFKLNLEQDQTVGTRYIRTFCNFWIRNRSDSDLFFRDNEHVRDSKSSSSPKVFLRGCPPGTIADKFICFSGPWLSFQRPDVTEDIWLDVGVEVSEIDKPVHLRFDGLSLLLDVRPAKGRFQKALVVTIRNAVWLENRTGTLLQWCQPEALNQKGIALSTKVHSIATGERTSLHWDYRGRKKAICLRRANVQGASDWFWSRPVIVDGVEGEFAAKMYRPKRHEQYIARVVISKLGSGVAGIVVHKEDRNTPPYRILNNCQTRSIAFRQSGVNETHPWLVRPGKSTRYSWDDPQAPVKRRSLVVEVIDDVASTDNRQAQALNSSSDIRRTGSVASEMSEVSQQSYGGRERREKTAKSVKFELNIDYIIDDVPFNHAKKLNPPLTVSVHVNGPTKVVTFCEHDVEEPEQTNGSKEAKTSLRKRNQVSSSLPQEAQTMRNLDFEVFIRGFGISLVESTPVELAYLSVTGIHFRMDRFDGQQLLMFQVQDVQLDNQLLHSTWPVVLWSPPPKDQDRLERQGSSSKGPERRSSRKPFFQFTLDGPHPAMKQGIGNFRGIFLALQQLQVAADEDFVLRAWLFVVSLIEAAGGSNQEKEEALSGKDGLEEGIHLEKSGTSKETRSDVGASPQQAPSAMNRLYVEHLDLCPLKLTISFTSSRTSTAAEQIGGFRSLIRTLVAVLGNVENAEFRFNALELRHVFDTTSHFRSLITEYYVSQGSNQKMVLLASNSLIGNPSALFDSIAIGTRDFFVEPANAKGSADFIASIGRGSSSFLTNTVGGIVGSLGGIPRAVAQGLETAVGDRDYLAERDSIRGGRARAVSSPAQGLFTGALSFGHGIASGAAGLIRDPLQGAAEEGPSGFIKGLGKGFIGGVLKPITGALDLLAEPAAGFRSMMVSDRNYNTAEPARPPRAFWGVNGDRMTSYDLRAALGQAILDAVNRNESAQDGERLQSWTHLVPVHANANDDDVIMFLWALLRRSTRSSPTQAKYLLDAEGNPQRAEKMRAGLITTRRLILTSLDGHIIWEYPLHFISDTQVSMGFKDFLMVGMKPIGQKQDSPAPTGWQKIHCGSMASRDELNAALRKALTDIKVAHSTYSKPNVNNKKGIEYHEKRQKKNIDRRREHRRDLSVELADMSGNQDMDQVEGQMLEMKSIHQDASVDGKRGVFTDLKMPGRHGKSIDLGAKNGFDDSLSKELADCLSQPLHYQHGAVRSLRICFVNDTNEEIKVSDALLDSGDWAGKIPSQVKPKSVCTFEADGTSKRVIDIAGRIIMKFERNVDKDENIVSNSTSIIAIRFLNPILASNAFAVHAPIGYTIRYRGGEKGDHVTTVVTLKRAPEIENQIEEVIPLNTGGKPSAEPLLFGRSKVSPFLPPLPTNPKKKRDAVGASLQLRPEMVAKLASLGFAESDAKEALEKSEGDLSKAYAFLTDEERTQV